MARKRVSENPVVISSAAAAAPARRKVTAKRSTRTVENPDIAEVEAAIPEVTEAAPVAAIAAPTHEEIAKQAYLYSEARGFQGGSPEEDWLRAEQELLARISR